MNKENDTQISTLLLSFWKEMNKWEKETYQEYTQGAGDFEEKRKKSKEALLEIYNKFLTNKTRKSGRLAGPDVGAYPEFDESLEDIENIEKLENGKYIITTRRRDPNIADYFTKHRYKIVKKTDQFLIDSKENYSSYEEKWERDVF